MSVVSLLAQVFFFLFFFFINKNLLSSFREISVMFMRTLTHIRVEVSLSSVGLVFEA